jgi:pimeloyl-ACP methyl ester carboxylesterase
VSGLSGAADSRPKGRGTGGKAPPPLLSATVAPTLLLLHGFPSASHQFRRLIDALGSRYRLIAPDGWTLDQHFLDLPGRKQIQADLAFDYHTSVERYPRWQAWLLRYQPPTLIVWGRNDPFFLEAGARAYLRDLPAAELHPVRDRAFRAGRVPGRDGASDRQLPRPGLAVTRFRPPAPGQL